MLFKSGRVLQRMTDALGLIELDQDVEVLPTVQPVYVLEVPRPQDVLSRSYIGEAAQNAVAAEFGALGLVNPVGSGVIVRPKRFIFTFTNETSGWELHTSSDTTFGALTVLTPGATDFQNPGSGAAKLRVGTDPVFNNLPGFKKQFIPLAQGDPVNAIGASYWDFEPSGWVLTPGTALWLASLTVNTFTFGTWEWKEELRRPSSRQ